MIFLLALVAIGAAGGLAARAGLSLWVPWLVPIALAGVGCLFWLDEVDENRNLIVAEVVVIEILTLAAISGGRAYRRWRDGEP